MSSVVVQSQSSLEVPTNCLKKMYWSALVSASMYVTKVLTVLISIRFMVPLLVMPARRRARLFGSVQKIAGTTAKILTASASQQVTEILKIKLIAVFAYVVNPPAHRPISPELVSGI